MVSNEWDDCDEYSGWYGGWIEFSDEYDSWVEFSDECDEWDGISSGSSEDPEWMSYGCCLFLVDIDWLLNVCYYVHLIMINCFVVEDYWLVVTYMGVYGGMNFHF